jgi:hypothetical protein
VKEAEENKDPNKLTWRDYLLLAAIVVVFCFYKDDHENIINYPEYLRYGLWILLFAAVAIIWFKKFASGYNKQISLTERLVYILLNAGGAAVLALIVAGILVTPFNYYNEHVAAQNRVDTVRCDINDAFIGKKTDEGRELNTINYTFQSKANTLHTTAETPLIANMHELHMCGQFQLVVAAHRALWGSYMLEDWKIEEKNAMPEPSKKRQ